MIKINKLSPLPLPKTWSNYILNSTVWEYQIYNCVVDQDSIYFDNLCQFVGKKVYFKIYDFNVSNIKHLKKDDIFFCKLLVIFKEIFSIGKKNLHIHKR